MAEVDELIQEAARQAAKEAVERVLEQSILAPEYQTTAQAAAYLGLSRQKLEIWRSKGG